MTFNATRYVLIEGDPFLSRARSYREQQNKTRLVWTEFALKYNGTGTGYSFEKLVGIEIDRGKGPPSGWVRIRDSRRYGFRPRKGTPAMAEMQALPVLPLTGDVFVEVPDTLSWRDPPSMDKGFTRMGRGWQSYEVGWIEDTYFGSIPNIPAYVEIHRKEYPDSVIQNDLDKWTLPTGLKWLTDGEYDLMWAQYKVKTEREAA